ncbi:glutathione S-transferase family protein [Pseudobacteriovorax antillogorgiicola]|uniref:Glutathione S-transferase n=1 Tax=Pseudobacteriovorax antillogorgiicola TaxID=1513793 RepID=A0A1Y6CRS3_9BACT|nr:glutathione S-transferase family protein [Pseudobacteriovorax antillogorgiicola]TCS41564.1 glutathione S-transferase [Pseudobacteriovorax antillogorgiicola]SMF83386.1 Glutathione S-transferase [Pseudobacteriovorax antillogorgiicola]
MVPKVTAYTADISICSQICRLAVYEQGLRGVEHVNIDIEYEMENYDPWFVKIQPTMTVPVLVYNKKVVGDSRDILMFLQERHPEAGLYPKEHRDSIDSFIDNFYERFGLIGAFTFGNLATRGPTMQQFIKRGKREITIAKLKALMQHEYLRQHAEQKLAKLDQFDLLSWAMSQDLNVLDSKMSELLDQMDQQLADGRPLLMGETYSLADVVATAYCARIHFIKGLGLFSENVRRYWELVKSRQSFVGANVCSTWEDTLMAKQFAKFQTSSN